MAVQPLEGRFDLDNQPFALTAACLQAVLHTDPDTTLRRSKAPAGILQLHIELLGTGPTV
jgi:hypothetical protein